jgi:hypothetical protein
MQVRAADTAVRNLNVDVIFTPAFRLKFTPGHLALHGVLVLSEPALELSVGHVDIVSDLDKFIVEGDDAVEVLNCNVDFVFLLH